MPDFFDRLITEIVQSAPALEGSQPLRSRSGRKVWSRIGRHRPPARLLVVIGLLCVSGAVGGLALAGTFSGQIISPQQWVEGHRVKPASAITAAQAAALGILRRPRTATDALLPADAFSAAHSPMAANGVNPALSRQAAGIPSGSAWVLPGNGKICLIAENAQGLAMTAKEMSPGSTTLQPVGRIPGANGATGCTDDATAATGWSAGASESGDAPGLVYTAGLVPDGVHQVTIHTASGAISVPVHENVYVAEVIGWPSTVSFKGPAGPVTLDNGSAPAVQPVIEEP